jgi:hypothetical protein
VDARGGGRVPPQVRASVTRELPHGESEQIYACKFVEDTLLTASDDCVHFWDVETGCVRRCAGGGGGSLRVSGGLCVSMCECL